MNTDGSVVKSWFNGFCEALVIGILSILGLCLISTFLAVTFGSDSNPINRMILSAFALEQVSACTFIPPENM